MVWQGMNKRTFPRINVACDLTIDAPEVSVLKTKTENLGAGGLCVILDRELDKFSTVHLQILLTHDTFPVKGDGKVVWLVKSRRLGLDSSTVQYDVGIEFINISDADRERINRFIQNHQK